MQNILVLGAGKSATILIEYLLSRATANDLFIRVADADPVVAQSKIAGHERAEALPITPGDADQLERYIKSSDLVVSMLPPPLHPTVARACLRNRKHFLNASYLTPEIKALDEEARAKGLTFICEMGLDPGIDHMSAMEMIDGIRNKGGKVSSFRSHCGGLISPESDNNPWHYKISWNPRNIVMAGSDGARYLEDGKTVFVEYPNLFDPAQTVSIPGHNNWSWYANRDSLSYIGTYGLEGVHDFVRTTLRHPDFAFGWKHIVTAGLTRVDDAVETGGITTRQFFSRHGIDGSEKGKLHEMFAHLGAYSDEALPSGMHSSADVLQWILERKLALSGSDKDMIIMLHEIGYEMNGAQHYRSAHLVVKGDDQQHTAMARTVGMPLAIAAIGILNGTIHLPGVTIPVHREIYEKVLPELEANGICFTYAD